MKLSRPSRSRQDVEDLESGAARLIVATLLEDESLHRRFPTALSDGEQGSFCGWLCEEKADELGLSAAARKRIRNVFLARPGDFIRRLYFNRQDLQREHPLALTPVGLRSFLRWLLTTGRADYALSDESIWWHCLESSEDGADGLLSSFLVNPNWQILFPDAVTPFGWDRFVDLRTPPRSREYASPTTAGCRPHRALSRLGSSVQDLYHEDQDENRDPSRAQALPTLETRTPPLPPQVLRERVRGTGARDAEFLQNGWRIYSDLRRVLDRHSRVEDFGRILDWGCGCGRVSRHFMNAVPHSSFFGCDIDSDAIDWMEQVYPTSRFDAIRPLPPTPYQNEFFDLVYGVSILTHLDEATQFRWLDELRRIITKDGVVAVSILDESSCPTELLPLVKAKGFFDEPSRQSADFAPFSDEDYYRATYHSKAYVMERWSKGFEILEYVEGGIVSHQSLVLMRRRDEGSSVDVSREVEWRGKTSALESLRIFYCLTWYRVRRLLGRLWRKLGWAREHP